MLNGNHMDAQILQLNNIRDICGACHKLDRTYSGTALLRRLVALISKDFLFVCLMDGSVMFRADVSHTEIIYLVPE